jgi:hypothetical protein
VLQPLAESAQGYRSARLGTAEHTEPVASDVEDGVLPEASPELAGILDRQNGRPTLLGVPSFTREARDRPTRYALLHQLLVEPSIGCPILLVRPRFPGGGIGRDDREVVGPRFQRLGRSEADLEVRGMQKMLVKSPRQPSPRAPPSVDQPQQGHGRLGLDGQLLILQGEQRAGDDLEGITGVAVGEPSEALARRQGLEVSDESKSIERGNTPGLLALPRPRPGRYSAFLASRPDGLGRLERPLRLPRTRQGRGVVFHSAQLVAGGRPEELIVKVYADAPAK